MLKSPKTAALKKNAIQVVSLASGAMLSRGVNNLVPVKDSTLQKAIVAGTAVALAAAYKGPSKDMVIPALVGMAAYQTVDIVSDQVGKRITKKADPNPIEKFGYDALGLAGGCGCHDQEVPAIENWNALGNPAIVYAEYDRVAGEETQYTDFEEVSDNFGL